MFQFWNILAKKNSYINWTALNIFKYLWPEIRHLAISGQRSNPRDQTAKEKNNKIKQNQNLNPLKVSKQVQLKQMGLKSPLSCTSIKSPIINLGSWTEVFQERLANKSVALSFCHLLQQSIYSKIHMLLFKGLLRSAPKPSASELYNLLFALSVAVQQTTG